MSKLKAIGMGLMVVLQLWARLVIAEPFLLSPPDEAGPIVVLASFELLNINSIDDQAETFEMSGVLTLKWTDPRQAFDPVVAGVDEKIFQGAYQFDEVSTGWSPSTSDV